MSWILILIEIFRAFKSLGRVRGVCIKHRGGHSLAFWLLGHFTDCIRVPMVRFFRVVVICQGLGISIIYLSSRESETHCVVRSDHTSQHANVSRNVLSDLVAGHYPLSSCCEMADYP